MLYNATILRITAPNPPTTGGGVTFTPAVGVLAIRCQLGNVSQQRRYEIGAAIKDSTAQLRVERRGMQGWLIVDGCQIEVLLDGEAASETYIVDLSRKIQKAGLSNFLVFLRKA